MGGLVELTDPFHSAPGEEEFHTKPELHVNGVGITWFLTNSAANWQIFFDPETRILRNRQWIMTRMHHKCFMHFTTLQHPGKSLPSVFRMPFEFIADRSTAAGRSVPHDDGAAGVFAQQGLAAAGAGLLPAPELDGVAFSFLESGGANLAIRVASIGIEGQR